MRSRGADLFRRIAANLGARPWFAAAAKRLLPPIDRGLHRLTGGRVMLGRAVFPTLLLTTTGRRTGRPRRQPLAYVETPRGWAVAATNFGQDHHPAWSANLLDEPRAVVEVDGVRHDVHARLLDDEEKARVWPRFVAMWPPYDGYVERSGRDIRVFELERA